VSGRDGRTIVTTRVLWGDALEGTARDLLAVADATDDPEERGASGRAAAWLWEYLSAGPKPSTGIQTNAGAAGHSWRTIERVKKDLGIVAKQRKEGAYRHPPRGLKAVKRRGVAVWGVT
jgi:putative DNA primase/helicase